MADELKPCPFCGGPLVARQGHSDITFLLCGVRNDGSDGCGAITSFRPDKRGANAIVAANRRPPAVPVAELEALPTYTVRGYLSPRGAWHKATDLAALTNKYRENTDGR